jgi:two-component system, NarL family, response regulator NreC
MVSRPDPPTMGPRSALVTIVLADNHPVVRRAVRALLEERAERRVIGEAGDAERALELVRTLRPDLLLLDVHMPGMSAGMGEIAEARQTSPGTVVVVLTVEADVAVVRRALAAGARAYVLKDAGERELDDALCAALRGEPYVSSALAARLVADDAPPPRPSLDGRQTAILRLLALGFTNREVAGRLAVSVRTVEGERAALQARLGSRSRADLVRSARAAGLWPAPAGPHGSRH